MGEIILQEKKKITPIVDTSMSILGYMPYKEAQKQNILHIQINILFIYNEMLFIRETKDSRWSISLTTPVLNMFSKQESIERVLLNDFGIKGAHITFLSKRKRKNIPYFELYYTAKLSYILTKELPMRGNFITITLLQQLFLLDKQAYTDELLYGVGCLE